MGARMAENLRRAGHDLVVHDSSIARLEEFSEHKGIQSVSTPAAVAEEEGGRTFHQGMSPLVDACDDWITVH